jgi:TolA-binding protein
MNLDPHQCQRALDIQRAVLRGALVNAQDLAFSRSHLATCKKCLADSVVIRAMSTPAAAPIDDLSRRRTIDRALAAAAKRSAAQRAFVETETSRRFRRIAIGSAGIAALLAIVLAWRLVPAAVVDGEVAPETAQLKGTERADSEPRTASASANDVSPSRQQLKERRAAEAPATRTVETRADRRVVRLPTGIEILLHPGTRLHVDQLTQEGIRVTLQKGRLLASVNPLRDGPPLTVSTGAGDIKVTGTVFSVSVSDEKDATVSVIEGRVRVTTGRDEEIHLGRGKQLSLGERTPEDIPEAAAGELWYDTQVLEKMLTRTEVVTFMSDALESAPAALSSTSTEEVTVSDRRKRQESRRVAFKIDFEETAAPSMKELLGRARALRLQREWRAAAKVYEELIRRYPNTDEATASLVTLGDIRLSRLGNPTAALSHYNAYLGSGRATLRPEVLIGKAKALGRLGRAAEARTTLETFLSHFPNALQAERVKVRLEELKNTH